MDSIINIVNLVVSFIHSAGISQWVTAVVSLLSALIAVSLLIPGDSPDKQLKAALDFVLKFSRK